MWTESGNSYRNRKLEIITSCCEALRGAKAVTKAAPIGSVERYEENHHEVDGQGNSDSNDGYDLVNYLVPLICEENEDRVQQAD